MVGSRSCAFWAVRCQQHQQHGLDCPDIPLPVLPLLRAGYLLNDGWAEETNPVFLSFPKCSGVCQLGERRDRENAHRRCVATSCDWVSRIGSVFLTSTAGPPWLSLRPLSNLLPVPPSAPRVGERPQCSSWKILGPGPAAAGPRRCSTGGLVKKNECGTISLGSLHSSPCGSLGQSVGDGFTYGTCDASELDRT